MTTTDFNEKEIMNNDIESPLMDQEDHQVENNTETKNNEVLSTKKVILNKNKRQLLPSNQDNVNENGEMQNIEIEINNEFNINKSDEIHNSQNEKLKDENKNENLEINEKEKNNELDKNGNKEKGYLDDDLDDEDNKKLYLRVIKRMEKTFGVPIISAPIPGKEIEDIELEENIRPILINKGTKNIKQKNELPKKQYLPNQKNNNTRYINNNIQNNIGQKPLNEKYYNPSINKITTYEYNLYNNYKEPKQYIMNPVNNKVSSYSTNKYNNNYINNPQKYSNKTPITNKKTYYEYGYQSQQKNMPKGVKSNNIYPINYLNINSKNITNKTPIANNRNYLYQNPYSNLNKKQNETPKYQNKNYNTKYYSYLNNKLEKSNNLPIRNLNYYSIGNTPTLLGDVPRINQERYNNYNNMGNTYMFSSNKLNKNNISNPNPNNNNHYKYHFTTQSLNNYRNPIIPKKTKIPLNYNNNNLLKSNKYSSPISYIINQRYLNAKNTTPINQKKNIYVNKSQNQFNLKNRSYNLYLNDNKNRNNMRNNSYNPLGRTLDIINYSKKYNFNCSPSDSLQNYQIRFNNNMSFGKNRSQHIPYVTYCIDSSNY